MQTIQIAVVRDLRYRSSDGFEIYGDGGSGVMDWIHPVTSRRLLFWEDALAMVPHLLGGHLAGFHLDSVRREGHVNGTHLLDQQGLPAGAIAFEVGPFVFGQFQHAVVTEDEVGNQAFSGAQVYSTLIDSYPPPAGNLRVEGFDKSSGVVSFSFTPSERLVG